MGDSTVGISPSQASSSSSATKESAGFLSIDWGDNEECPICRKALGSKNVAMPNCCSHFFCYTCIKSWVTKSKSNCPMDRIDIAQLKVFDNSGKYLRTEKVEPKEQEDEVEFEFDDDGICPDCGWMGMRATVGVCLHCMYHHENPFPVRNCPQCMEDESNASDEDWTPDATRDAEANSRRRTLRSDNNQHVIVDILSNWTNRGETRERNTSTQRRARAPPVEDDFIVYDSSDAESDHSVKLKSLVGDRGNIDEESSESDSEVEEEEEDIKEEVMDLDFSQPGPSTSRAGRAAAVVPKKKTVRKVATKKRRKASTVKRKRKVKKRRKTTTAAGTKTKRKRKVKKRRVVRKKKRVSNRPTLPEDSAKKRLARILGVKPPKYNGQILPRGCKKKPVTAAQRQAMASSSSGTSVFNRPVGSLDYHNNPTPTLHIFGGEELEYFPSDSDSEGTSSSCQYRPQKRPLPSTSASVIKRFKANALKSLRQRVVTVNSAAVKAPPSSDILGSIFEGQTKKFEIKSTIVNRIDPYKSAALSRSPEKAVAPRLRFSSDSKKAINYKKSPSREEDLDLYSDIPAAGGAGREGGEEESGGGADENDYLFDEGAGGSSSGGNGDGDDDDEEDKKVKPDEAEEEEAAEEEEEEEEEAEGINEMVIDESVVAQEDEIKEEDDCKDPLEMANEEEKPLPSPVAEVAEAQASPQQVQPASPERVLPDVNINSVLMHEPAPVQLRPIFKYSNTSLQIARHLNVEEELASKEPEEEEEDYPEEPCSDNEEEVVVEKPAETRPQISPVKLETLMKKESPVKKELVAFTQPLIENGEASQPSTPRKKTNRSPMTSPVLGNGTPKASPKQRSKVKSRKKSSLVEEIFGSSDVEEERPARKVSTDKSGHEGSEDGEIREKKGLLKETEEVPKEVEKVVEEVKSSPVRKRSIERKKKKDKSKEGGKKKRKERRRSRSRSGSTSLDRRKKHHSRKYSPPRRSRKKSRSRSRSRKRQERHEENGRMSIHERLGPKRGRSRDRSEDRSEKKEVYSSGENILVSVNFSRRRKRIAEIAAKRRPVAVINLAVDDDKSPVIEKGDSPKEVIDLGEGWSSDDEEVKRPKQKETPQKQKDSGHKSLKIKETGPKTPPEPQVKFHIAASRPQLKLKNVLGVDDDDDEDEEQASANDGKDSATSKPVETYDPFNPTASPAQEAENEPPRTQQPQPKSAADQPQQRALSPPKLLTEMPKLERPPPVVPAAARPVPDTIFPGLPANVANILCSSQLQNVFNPQLGALAVPLLLSAPCFVNMQSMVQQPVTEAPTQAQPKVDNGVVDMELESPYSPAASEGDDLFEPPKNKTPSKANNKAQEKFDNIFGSTNKRVPAKTAGKAMPSKGATPKKEVKTTVTTSTGKKDISIKMDRNNLKIVGDVPNAAIEVQVKEKFLKKLNRQERVVEEVKLALKPHYTKKLINKEEYKDILRRAVPKVCHNKSGEINPAKIKGLVNEYVKRIRHERKKSSK